MLKPDRFSCSQKIQLKWDPPVHMNLIIFKVSAHVKNFLYVLFGLHQMLCFNFDVKNISSIL